jgi:hypothetical protein
MPGMRELPADYRPLRIFLDTNTLQCLQEYGDCIFEHDPFVQRRARSGASEEDIYALEGIALFIARNAFEFALSKNSLREVRDSGDRRYLQWAFDVLDHWQACIDGRTSPFSGLGRELAERFEEKQFNQYSEKDRALLRDAVALECDTFLTIERRLPKNWKHLARTFGIQIVRPPELFEWLRPQVVGL